GSWQVFVRAKDRGISTAVGGHHNIIYAAVEWLAVFVGIPTAQLFAGHVEFKDGAMLLGAREQERPLFRERQPVMAATRGMIQNRGRFAIPFRQRVRNPANVVKVAVNVQRTLGSKDIADDGDFVGTRCRGSQHRANGEADNLTYLHFEPVIADLPKFVAADSNAFSRAARCSFPLVSNRTLCPPRHA